MKNNYIKQVLALFMAVAVFASSCNKEQDTNHLTTDKAIVSIKMEGIGQGRNLDNVLRASASTGKNNPSPAVQRVEISFNEEYDVTATLIPVGAAVSNTELRASAKRAEAGVNPEIEELADGSSYVVAVYDAAGNYVAHNVFIHQVGNLPQYQFELEPGEYTFLAVATGGSDNSWMADALNGLPLQQLDLTNLGLDTDLDILWQKQEKNIQAGPNIVNLLMDHLFTRVLNMICS